MFVSNILDDKYEKIDEIDGKSVNSNDIIEKKKYGLSSR